MISWTMWSQIEKYSRKRECIGCNFDPDFVPHVGEFVKETLEGEVYSVS